ncbi:MAG: NAD(P)/FAD-dependent oxidoreductase [Candidatus Woesebacteria bacterium]|nr:NAD(P)/FAD-dependent oxidoreductase [Candidatus Woesebacteria bacterium]
MNEIFDVAIVGAGPAGMMAGISSKTSGNCVCILEKNDQAGKKLLISGKGRCNVTTSKDIHEIVTAFGENGKFLYGTLSQFSNQDVINFFESREVPLKEERGDRMFPVSDKSISILNCLLFELKKKNVNIFYNFSVKKITKNNSHFKISDGENIVIAKKIIITTGGKSYPETGSTGDGYRFAESFGHNVVRPVPALVPLIVHSGKLNSLAGLSLKNVELTFTSNGEVFSHEFGEMLFTHKGISGPIVLKLSKKVYLELTGGNKVTAKIDLKPKLDETTLRQRIIREIQTAPKKEYQSLLATLLPKLLITYAIYVTKIDKHHQSSTLDKTQITSLINFLKNFTFEIDGVESIDNAIVTHGGVDIKEIDRKTMESKITPGVYFAGEIICLDGPTGGFNMQKAFSTGYVAGKSAS